MTPLETALLEVVDHLQRHRIPFMVIGGAAINLWGNTRSTKDVDVSVWVADDDLEKCVHSMVAVFPARIANPVEFARTRRILLLQTPAGIDVDISLALLPFEQEAIRRAPVKLLHGREVKVGSVTDLVILKAIAGRPQDEIDLQFLISRYGSEIDRKTLDRKIGELAQALSRPELEAQYIRCWKSP